ncbi:hypothetical protein CAEBREN_05072 [Caenorhabditis brenneri]|uniref:Uncharacterized protein n=1 Tax=Caenorhabditis brenneri TaxID=135651 RepID=G0NWN7_CAEBE|nr:hypothetical protein CAEBREN_05072 [Caenorhabditis brenneri]
MLFSGSVLRGIVTCIYLLIISVSTALTLYFYSEPVLFAFVIIAVALLVLSYPILCLFTVTRSYDLELRGCCGGVEWVPISEDIERIEKQETPKNEKVSKLDEAFIYAYM